MVGDKNIGHCRVLKGGRITIPKEVREKLSIKDGDFVDFVLTRYLTRYRSIKIIKFEFDWNKAMKQIDNLRKQKKIVLS
ncbi:MAG: AbrB/MazE/SpoVT family DNA-binding domain-containing protein [Deltaproteobacteria bacterium]